MTGAIEQVSRESSFIRRQKFVLTTSWDDGDPLDLRVAEYLAGFGLKGTFYVPCQNVRRTLSAHQLCDISGTFEVGAHTVHHVDVTSLPDQDANREIFESKSRLEEITGKPCRAFCFPMGGFRKKHLGMVGSAGYLTARTVELLSVNGPTRENGVAVLPTTVQAYPHQRISYWKNFAKRFRLGNLPALFAAGSSANWVALAISILGFARRHGGIFHLWGHSREIDDTNQWKHLETVLAAMKEAAKDGVCVTNSELSEFVH